LLALCKPDLLALCKPDLLALCKPDLLALCKPDLLALCKPDFVALLKGLLVVARSGATVDFASMAFLVAVMLLISDFFSMLMIVHFLRGIFQSGCFDRGDCSTPRPVCDSLMQESGQTLPPPERPAPARKLSIMSARYKNLFLAGTQFRSPRPLARLIINPRWVSF
jgi:hypothetical protein